MPLSDTPLTDEEQRELLELLRRVTSDLRFRQRARRRFIFLTAIIAFDLLVSVGSVVAIVRSQQAIHKVEKVQTTSAQEQFVSCQRDNTLRQAYITQWQPILDAAKQADDPKNRDTVQRFSVAFEGFKVHPC